MFLEIEIYIEEERIRWKISLKNLPPTGSHSGITDAHSKGFTTRHRNPIADLFNQFWDRGDVPDEEGVDLGAGVFNVDVPVFPDRRAS